MATNAKRSVQVTLSYEVAASDTATEGYLLIMDSDTTVDDAPAGTNLGFAVALETKAAGKMVSVAPLSGNCCIPVKVGTGGATRGKKAKWAADGFTDAPALADGDTVTPVYGVFAESGSAGDMAGLFPCPAAFQESV